MRSIDDLVEARRPDGSTVHISRRAYNGVYTYRGWELVNGEEETDDAGPKPLSRMTRDELDAVALNRGIEDPKAAYPKKGELLVALQELEASEGDGSQDEADKEPAE